MHACLLRILVYIFPNASRRPSLSEALVQFKLPKEAVVVSDNVTTSSTNLHTSKGVSHSKDVREPILRGSP